MTKDRLFHLILFGIILALTGISVYLGLSLRTSIVYKEEVLLPNIYRLKQEQDLQNIKEVTEPGSVHVPILIYHSVRPHVPNELPLVKYYDVSPASLEKQLKYLDEEGYTVISLS